MRVFIITNNPLPNGMASTHRIDCYAKALARQGVTCEVIIYHRTEIYGRKPKNTIGSADLGEYRYQYIGGTPLRGSNVFYRQFSDLMDKFRTTAYLRKQLRQGDVLFLYMSEEHFLTYLLIRLAHQLNIPIVRELCEYPYGTKEETLKIRWKRAFYMRHIFPKLDGAVCISESLYQFAKKHHPHGHFFKVPILVENSRSRESYRHTHPYIYHGGTLYERKDAIVSTMQAFGEACVALGKKVDFILSGPPSPHQQELNDLIHRYDIEDNVFFLPQQPPEKVAQYQNGAFLTILNKHDNSQNRNGFSTKLGEVLMSETAVITTTVGEANYWLKDGESAYIVAPGHPELIKEKIIEAFNDEKTRNRIAHNGKLIAEQNFNLSYQGARLHGFFEQLILEKSSR